ncbi:MAG TPA: DNA ligase D [Fimbriimonadaceae bacterium]|nr:DNA ligase D [Fimbriimonadaceae bacterium]
MASRNLSKYKAKRNFSDTPEPRGKVGKKGHLYVVQKHAARRLHYDLRLEHRGVLLSWAVPKEPSLDPEVKRLAVRVEDHPVEYGSFEGEIPKGNYGAGKVEIWDRGSWSTDENIDQALEEGKLSFNIEGEKLHGSFALVRMGEPSEKENWLLIKHRDLDMEVPGFMLCRPVETPPKGDEWIHEIKWDGYRAFAVVSDGACRFVSRGGNDLTVPDLQAIVGKAIPGDAILDGELVVFNKEGQTDFGMLQATLRSDRKDICYIAFDLLFHDGEDLKSLPLTERKERLQKLLPKPGRLRFSDGFENSDLYEKACDLGLEGIVSKRRDSPYRSGRFDDWRKIKCIGHEEFVVGGFTIFAGTRNSVGSLIVGQMRDGKLEYAGRLGTGFDERARRELYDRLEPLTRKTPPFTISDSKDKKGAIWVEPEVQVKGKFASKTARGIVRHSRFDGVLDMPTKAPQSAVTQFKVTSGDRVVDKQSGATKQMLADFYVAVLDRIFPQLQNRPISVIRCPEGVNGDCFFQRHLKNDVEGTEPIPVNDEEYIGLVKPEGVLGLVQYGGIEFHPWGSRIKDVRLPDRLIFDLDPGPGVEWSKVRDGARVLKELLESLGLKTFLKISGGKGLHVVCPIKPELEWDQAKSFTRTLAENLVKSHPKDFVSKMSKSIRNDKIFVDYLRNDQTSTAVAAYSLRARPGLPVAWPILWEDLDNWDSPSEINIANFEEWLDEPDPWANVDKSAVSLKKILKL